MEFFFPYMLDMVFDETKDKMLRPPMYIYTYIYTYLHI